MSDLNDALKDSYIGKVADALKPYSAELTTAGFDPTSRITQTGCRREANRVYKRNSLTQLSVKQDVQALLLRIKQHKWHINARQVSAEFPRWPRRSGLATTNSIREMNLF